MTNKYESKNVATFYDELAPFYHLIYPDWSASLVKQATALDSIIKQFWGEAAVHTILDAACGIGTQALGLAHRGYQVTGSDLSEAEIARAKQEAATRSLTIEFIVADMRDTFTALRGQQFDLVLACDNSLPHLLSNTDLRDAFQAFYACSHPGGGCLISVRDYEKEQRSGTQIKPAALRHEGGNRHLVFQVWEFEDDLKNSSGDASDRPLIYDLSLYLITDTIRIHEATPDTSGQDPEGEKGETGHMCHTRLLRSRYYAVTIPVLMGLMEEAGFEEVTRIDDVFYQPVLVGKKPVKPERL